MDIIAALRPLLRDVARVDHTKVSIVTPLRNAVGTVLPLAAGAATGQLLAGLTASIGALNVAFSDMPGAYRVRAERMLLASTAAALSVFAGSATGALDLLAVALAMVWGFAGGLLVALGPAATQIGLTSVVQLLVFGAQPQPPERAAALAALVFAGGLLQTLLAIVAWPLRRSAPQREALAAVFRELATYTRALTPAGASEAPAATAAMTDARTALAGVSDDHSATGEALRVLLDEAERIRLELLALDAARQQLRAADEEGEAAALGWIGTALEAAGDTLDALAFALETGHPAAARGPLERIEAAARALRSLDGTGGPGYRHTPIVARLEALGGQLRAAMEIAAGEGAERDDDVPVEEARPPLSWLRESLDTLRANLTPRSAAYRHALRLACCLLIADALARGLALPRSYWAPMTAAFVLRPDFAATFTRGLGRTAGTILGLGLTTALLFIVVGDVPGRIALVGALMFVIRGLGPANYGLLTAAVTALVVVLTSFAGARPETTLVERGLYTLAGGLLALSAYAVWPTWERTQAPAVLADLLDTYRRYFAVVMTVYLERQRGNPDAPGIRQEARLARTNAEASIGRLRNEPAWSMEELNRLDGLLSNSHRFAHSVMALETDLYYDPSAPAPLDQRTLRVFVDDVDTTLRALGAALRDPSQRLDRLPDLRADQRALANGVDTQLIQADPRRGAWSAALITEADHIADSINTMADLLRHASSNSEAIQEPEHMMP